MGNKVLRRKGITNKLLITVGKKTAEMFGTGHIRTEDVENLALISHIEGKRSGEEHMDKHTKKGDVRSEAKKEQVLETKTIRKL